MLSVTFNQPIVIDAANLHSLLSLANTPAVVTPYVDPAPVADPPVKATRSRKSAASSPAAPAAGDRPKRTRATKAEMEARRAAAAGEAAPAPEVKPTVAPEAAVKETAKSSKASAKPAAAPEKAEAKGGKKGGAKASGNGASTPEYAQKLLDRFAVLIDKDFDVASGLLAEFGVKRFSEMKPEQHSAFDAKLSGAGV